MEEFIEGTIATFDGLTDKDGNPVFFTSLRYSQGVMETVNKDLMGAFGHSIVQHMAMPSVFALAMGDYAYLVRTPDLHEMLAAAEFIQELS